MNHAAQAPIVAVSGIEPDQLGRTNNDPPQAATIKTVPASVAMAIETAKSLTAGIVKTVLP